MKVSDYIVSFLKSLSIKHVFGITGSAIAHVYDSFRKFDDIDIELSSETFKSSVLPNKV